MRWEKLGQIWSPSQKYWWAKSHAHLPTPLLIDEKTIRVYFAALDENKFGRISFVDLDAEDPKHVLRVHSDYVLDLGELGSFDDCGVIPSCAINVGEKILLYYVAFQRTVRTPYMLFSGLAESADGGLSFTRVQRTPVLDRTPAEPFSRGAPFVRYNAGNYECFYWSCTHWSVDNDVVHYNNDIRRATSTDGVSWNSDPKFRLAPQGSEYALGRPWVTTIDGSERMFFSARAHDERYAIHCALLDSDLIRVDSGISRSDSGWDSEMICYPAIVESMFGTYLFYNGNQHGFSGFGCARLTPY